MQIYFKKGQKETELAPNVRLIKDDNLQDDLLSREINAAVMYTSQVTAALKNNSDLKVVFPKEGIGFGVMASFVTSKAPNKDAAYKFLNYILEPKNAAKCASHIGYYCTNSAAEKYLSKKEKKYLTIIKKSTRLRFRGIFRFGSFLHFPFYISSLDA